MYLFDVNLRGVNQNNFMTRVILSFVGMFIIALCSAMPAHDIKIGLDDGVKQSYIGSSKQSIVVDGKTGKSLFTLNAFVPYTIRAYNNAIVIKIDGKYYSFGTNYIKVKPKQIKCFLASKRKWFRGVLVVYNINK